MKLIHPMLLALSAMLAPLIVEAQITNISLEVKLLEAPNQLGFNVGDIESLNVSYDQSDIQGIGDEVISVDKIVSLHFHFGGVAYDQSADSASQFPAIYFTDSKFTGIDFWNTSGLRGGGERSFFRFFKDQTFDYSPLGESEFSGSYRVTSVSVPEPKPALFLCFSMGFLLFKRQINTSH